MEKSKRAAENEAYSNYIKDRLSKAGIEPEIKPTEEAINKVEGKLSKFKKPALIGAGIIGASGLAYGGYRMYKNRKNKNESETTED